MTSIYEKIYICFEALRILMWVASPTKFAIRL